MGAKFVAAPLVGAVVVAILSGCSSSASSPKSAAAPAATSSAAPPPATSSAAPPPATSSAAPSQASATTSAPDDSLSVGHQVSDLLGTAGHSTAATVPTAKPEWVARLQQTDAAGNQIDAKNLNLIALVDEAAREHDLNGLVRLSNGRVTRDQLSQPKVLSGLVAVLEKTHGAATDGLTFPGFALGGDGMPTSIADRKALGVASADGYKGLITVFGDGGTGRPFTWDSVTFNS